MLSKLRMGGLAVILLALVSCATTFEIRSVEDGVAQAYKAITTLALETVDARDEGFITEGQAQQIKGLLSDGLYNLDNATTLLEAKAVSSAESRLAQAQSILQAVVEILQRHQEIHADP